MCHVTYDDEPHDDDDDAFLAYIRSEIERRIAENATPTSAEGCTLRHDVIQLPRCRCDLEPVQEQEPEPERLLNWTRGENGEAPLPVPALPAAGSQEAMLLGMYGSLAVYSDFTLGDDIHYRLHNDTGDVVTGTVLWALDACAAFPQRYIVRRHGFTGFPDCVLSTQVVGA